MTNYAVTIYRRETRAALARALGRHVTNNEQNDFIYNYLWPHVREWLDEEARRWLVEHEAGFLNERNH